MESDIIRKHSHHNACVPRSSLTEPTTCSASNFHYTQRRLREEDHLGNQDGDELDGLGADEFAGVDESQPLLSPHATLPREASHNDCEDSVLIVEAYPGAGQVLGYDTTTHTAYSRTSYDLVMEGNPYHPFFNKGDYEVARWAMERGLGQNAFTDLLSIDGV